MRLQYWLGVSLLVAAASVPAHTQVAAPVAPAAPAVAEPPRFEAASVKRNAEGGMLVSISTNRGQFQATNVPLRVLLNQALQVQGSQVLGAPDWTQTERYDVVAKMPEGVTLAPGVQQAMLRALLEDRFKLVARKETRELPIYALVVARSDGRLGPNLSVTRNDCSPGRGRGAGTPAGGPPPPPPQFTFGDRPPCGVMAGPGMLAAGGITMTRIAELLSANAGRIVADRTGLSGLYEFNLTFTPDQIPQFPGGTPPPGMQIPVIDPNGPALLTAVQEQLGLKLDSTRGPVEVTVIDRIERPTED
jgi:uncharacterized protein (TIGR03435 family)